MKYHVFIATERKESILDPQGKATQHALDSLGISQVVDVRIGKYIRLAVSADSKIGRASCRERVYGRV